MEQRDVSGSHRSGMGQSRHPDIAGCFGQRGNEEIRCDCGTLPGRSPSSCCVVEVGHDIRLAARTPRSRLDLHRVQTPEAIAFEEQIEQAAVR